MKYILLLLSILLSPIQTLAHSWYPISCCSDGDCKPINCEDISEEDDGSMKYRGLTFFKQMIHPTQDKDCHACIGEYRDSLTPRCLFIRPTS